MAGTQAGATELVELWSQVGTSVDETTAMRRAATLAASLDVSTEDCSELGEFFTAVAQRDPYRAVIGARLLRAVSDYLPATGADVAWALTTAAATVYIVFGQQIGDGDVQREAIDMVTAMTESAPGQAELGYAWLQLGLLHTQAIIGRTTVANLAANLANRMQRADRDAVVRPYRTALPPLQRDPVATLRAGIRALDNALRMGCGPTLKHAALERIGAERYVRDLDAAAASADTTEAMTDIGRRGLAAAADDPFIQASLLSELRDLGSPMTAEEDRLLALDPLELASNSSAHVAAWVAIHLVKARFDRPADAAVYAASAAALAPHLDEADRGSLLRMVFTALSLPMAMVMRKEADFEASEPWARRFLASRPLSSYERVGVLLAVATARGVPATDRTRMFTEAAQLDENFGEAIEYPLGYGWASTSLDESQESAQAGDYRSYVVEQARTIPIWTAIGLPDAARECLTNMLHVLVQITDDVVADTVAVLLPQVTQLESAPLGGNSASLQRIWRRLLAIAVHRQGDLETFLTLFQVAKAARTSAMLRAGPLQVDPELRDGLWPLLAQADTLRAGVVVEPPMVSARTRMFNELRLVVPYDDRLDDGQPDSPALQATNLERAFDSHLQSGLLRSAGEFVPRSVDEVDAILGPDAVLWSICEGEDIEGRPCLYSLLIAPGEPPRIVHRVVMGMHDELGIDDGTDEIVCSNHEISVAQVRMMILDGDSDAGAADAMEHLRQLAQTLFPEVIDHLRTLYDRGRRRLIIDACGALHVLPFHLVEDPDGPLGCRWTITATPGLEALFARERPRPRRDVPVAAFGMTFRDGGGYGLPPLWGAAAEASAVARPFGATAYLDRQCTEAAVTRALGTARFVHVASHGRQDVAAPSLQEIYTTAAAGDDGRLRACEILVVNLAGLEMATLSACETALGRVDLSDNPRGLAAALLLGGAQCVVGTLWRVRDAPARTFFSHLYERLAGGDARVDAFQSARLRTRERHPQPRDWGAFVYLGA